MKNVHKFIVIPFFVTVVTVYIAYILLSVKSLPFVPVGIDGNKNSIDDLQDILQGAKEDIGVTTSYSGAYFFGGYPPEGVGACTDVISKALKKAGYDLKGMVDADIQMRRADYSIDKPDPNIDFRRVANLVPFFKLYADSLTTRIIPSNQDNLIQWQAGDIVVYDKSIFTKTMHIGIVSDKRTWYGVPYIIHNYSSGTVESNLLNFWPAPIIHHFRFPKAVH